MPPLDTVQKTLYLKLTADIDSLTKKLTLERFPKTLKCRPGCAECCMQFSVLPLEAALIQEHLTGRPPLLSQEDTVCALLENNKCSIYHTRPIICRTQGLPLAYVDEVSCSIEVSACQLNFPDDYQFEQEDLLFMDQFNHQLAELNSQYCLANDLDPEKRIALSAIQYK